MKNLLFNFNSIEVFYGDDTLNAVIQIDERINDLAKSLEAHDPMSDFEKSEWVDRLNKLKVLNQSIQAELGKQVQKLDALTPTLEQKATVA